MIYGTLLESIAKDLLFWLYVGSQKVDVGGKEIEVWSARIDEGSFLDIALVRELFTCFIWLGRKAETDALGF